MNLNKLQVDCWQVAEDHGWHEDIGEHTMTEKLLLVHSEVSEALEEWRAGHGATEVYYSHGKPEGVPIELADVLIRVLDLAEIYNMDLEHAVEIKQDYNRTRDYRHGGKRV